MRTRLRQRTSFVGLGKDNRGVMRIVIDIKLESCYIERGGWERGGGAGGLRQIIGHEITREKQILVWFIPLPLLFWSSTWKMQSSAAAHAVLNNWVYVSWQQQTAVLGLCDKSRCNMSPAISPVYKQDMAASEERVCVCVCTLCNNSHPLLPLSFLCFQASGWCLSPTVKIALAVCRGQREEHRGWR